LYNFQVLKLLHIYGINRIQFMWNFYVKTLEIGELKEKDLVSKRNLISFYICPYLKIWMDYDNFYCENKKVALNWHVTERMLSFSFSIHLSFVQCPIIINPANRLQQRAFELSDIQILFRQIRQKIDTR